MRGVAEVGILAGKPVGELIHLGFRLTDGAEFPKAADDGGAGVFARFAEDGFEEVGRAVDGHFAVALSGMASPKQRPAPCVSTGRWRVLPATRWRTSMLSCGGLFTRLDLFLEHRLLLFEECDGVGQGGLFRPQRHRQAYRSLL